LLQLLEARRGLVGIALGQMSNLVLPLLVF
jgi:hypothetical protein